MGAPDVRPLLRGHLHAGAAAAAAFGGTYLVAMSAADRPRQLSMLVYGAGLTLLFSVSAAYHLRAWVPPRARILRRLDHASIFMLIAATYTPIAFNLLPGWWRVGILGVVWAVALAGAGVAVAGVQLPRWPRAGIYVAMGWLAVVALGQVGATLPWSALALLLAGGLIYTAGAVLYALRWPDPWPRIFGYHEVFHLLTILAAAAFYILIVAYVLPAPRP